MKFAERLIELRTASGKSAARVARDLGIVYTTYYNYEQSGREPKYELLVKIAEYFNCSVDYLLGVDNRAPITNQKTKSVIANMNKLSDKGKSTIADVSDAMLLLEKSKTETTPTEEKPKKSAKVTPIKTEDDEVEPLEFNDDEHEYRSILVLAPAVAGGGAWINTVIDADPVMMKIKEKDKDIPNYDVAFRVNGDSMEPTLQNGHIALFKVTTDLVDGKIYAVWADGGLMIKYVYRDERGVVLVSENENYKDFRVCGDDAEDFRVIGVYVGSLTPTDPSYR